MKQVIILIALFFCCISHAQKADFKHIDFSKSDSISNNFLNESLNNLPLLAYKLTSDLDTEVEKFRALYLWVSSNIEADHSFSEKTLRIRKKLKNDSTAFLNWNSAMQPKVFKRLLKDKKTICSGYAYLLKELCALANINCEIINGYSRTVKSNIGKIDIPNHSWNAVELDKKWYLVDATLASGFFFINENKFIKNYNDGYFLVDPQLFIKSHYPLDYKWALLKQQIDINDYVRAPLIYGETLKHNIIPILPKNLNTKVSKGDNVVFKLRVFNENQIENLKVVLSNGQSYPITSSENYNYKDGILEFKHQFKRRGVYDLHLKINNDIIVSYTIKVTKLNASKNLLGYNL